MTLSKEERHRRDEQRALERRLRGDNEAIVQRGTIEINPDSLKGLTSLEDSPDFRPMGDWMEEELLKPVEPFLLEDLIMPGGLTIIAGRPKLGKSFLILGGLMAMSCGRRNGFLRPVGVSPSLYYDIEGVATKTAARVKGMAIVQGLNKADLNLVHIHQKKQFEVCAPGAAAKIVKAVKEYGARTFVLDTFAATFTGDENAKKDVQKYLNILSEVRAETGCAAVLVHHMNKSSFGYKQTAVMMDPDNGLRGSSALAGAYDIIASLQDGYVRGEYTRSALMLRGKYSSDSWLKYSVHGDKKQATLINNNPIIPFKLEFGPVNDEYEMFEQGPSDRQPEGGRPKNYRDPRNKEPDYV